MILWYPGFLASSELYCDKVLKNNPQMISTYNNDDSFNKIKMTNFLNFNYFNLFMTSVHNSDKEFKPFHFRLVKPVLIKLYSSRVTIYKITSISYHIYIMSYLYHVKQPKLSYFWQVQHQFNYFSSILIVSYYLWQN